MSQDWSSIKRDQSEDRAHRRGTRVPVRVTELLVPDTIDTIVSERVQQKRENAKSITDVREILVELMKKI
jgi:SNF2 family DNA or RNA helicase